MAVAGSGEEGLREQARAPEVRPRLLAVMPRFLRADGFVDSRSRRRIDA